MVDFQHVGIGDPIRDIFSLIYSSTTSSFRFKHMEMLLRGYFSQFQKYFTGYCFMSRCNFDMFYENCLSYRKFGFVWGLYITSVGKRLKENLLKLKSTSERLQHLNPIPILESFGTPVVSPLFNAWNFLRIRKTKGEQCSKCSFLILGSSGLFSIYKGCRIKRRYIPFHSISAMKRFTRLSRQHLFRQFCIKTRGQEQDGSVPIK